MALLLRLLFFLHWIPDAHLQYFPPPWLSAFPAFTTESDAVEMICRAAFHKYECYFYPEGQNTNLKQSRSCQLSLGAPEIIKWTNQSSPGPIKMICYYVSSESNRTPSPHSAPVLVISQYPKPTLSVSYDAELDEVSAVCETQQPKTLSDNSRCFLYAGEDRQFFLEAKLQSKTNKNGNRVCTFRVQKNNLISRLQSANSRELSCDYSVHSDPRLHSAASDKYNMNRFFPIQTQPPAMKEESITASPVSSTHLVTKRRAAANLKPELTGTYDHQLDEFRFQCETQEPESGSDLTCFLYAAQSTKHFLQKRSERKESGHAACSFTVRKNDLINHLHGEINREVLCGYKFNSGPNKLSPQSDKLNITALLPEPTQPPPAEEKPTAASPVVSTRLTTEGGTVTASPGTFCLTIKTSPSTTTTTFPTTKTTPSTTTRTTVIRKDHITSFTTPGAEERTRGKIWIVLLSVTGAGVFLSVLVIACVCAWISKQRTESRRRLNLSSENKISMMPVTRMDKPESGADGINTPVTSLPPASQLPGYMEPNYSEVLDNSAFYSMSYSTTSAAAAPAEPAGPGRNKKKKSTKAPEDVYHFYSTIPDLQVQTKEQDQTYSLLQMH